MKDLMEQADSLQTQLDWDFLIKQVWEKNPIVDDFFLKTIWATSTAILPHLEVQVVVDDNNRIHVSKGTSGYVDFKINPVGMKLPIKCWIHTHPFGAAYWSGIDWRTIDTWRPMMKKAIVLGDRQRGIWNQGDGYDWVWFDERTEEKHHKESKESFLFYRMEEE